MAEPAKKTYAGSCHCGHIKYTVALALSDPPTAGRCNCTICLKTGFTSVRVATPSDFQLLSPSSATLDSNDEVGDYQFRSQDVHKYFCKKCGVQVFSKGKYVFEGTEVNFFTVNILTLDQPQPVGSEGEGLDLSMFKIKYADGRNDNWQGGTKDVPWPGGCV